LAAGERVPDRCIAAAAARIHLAIEGGSVSIRSAGARIGLCMHMRSAAAGGLLVMVLAGCGSQQTADVGEVAVESTMASVSGDALVRMASTVCETLTGEVTRGPVNSLGTFSQWKATVTALEGIGVPQRDAGAFIVYATSFNCPEKVSEYLPPS
jgi:hypothetical protein